MEGHSERGLALLRKASALAPEDPDVRQNLANLLSDLGQFEEATLIYKELVAKHPDQWCHVVNLSAALRRMGHFDEALRCALRALDIDPRQPLAWMAKGNAEACARRSRAAIASFEQAIALQPNFIAAHHSLCRLLLQKERGSWWSRRKMRRTRRAYQRWAAADKQGSTARFMLSALEGDSLPTRMPDEVVRATFDSFAADFELQLILLDYAGPQLMAAALHRLGLAEGARLDVLDAGCGTGLCGPLLRTVARRLEGIDLSPAMLHKARAKGCYDDLEEAELQSWLSAQRERFDLPVAADVLVYFGDLSTFFTHAAQALRADGCMAFTVERSDEPGYTLTCTGRYAHHRNYLDERMRQAGFTAIEFEAVQLRLEAGAPVHGWLVTARRGSPSDHTSTAPRA